MEHLPRIHNDDLLSDVGEAPETFTGRFLLMSMCNDISCDRKNEIKKNVWQMPESLKHLQRNLVLDNGHSLVQVLKRIGILRKRSPQGVWDHIADEMLLEFAESGHSISRATTP